MLSSFLVLKENCQAIFQNGCTIWNWSSLPPPFFLFQPKLQQQFSPQIVLHHRLVSYNYHSAPLNLLHGITPSSSHMYNSVIWGADNGPLTTGGQEASGSPPFSILGLWLWNTLSVLLTRSQRTNPQLSELWFFCFDCIFFPVSMPNPLVAQMVKNCLQCRRPEFNPCFGKIP